MRRMIVTATALSAALGLAACSSSTSTTPVKDASSAASSMSSTMASPSSTPMETSSSPMSSTSPETMAGQSKDIVDTAVAAGSFKTLAEALTAAGLVDTLKGPGPFTVFAPPDAAFAKLPAGTVQKLLADPKGKLTAILTYHVIPGKVMAADVLKMNGQKVKTVNGADLTVKIAGSEVMLVDATGGTVKVTTADVAASNGVIHVIDGVLLPSS